MQSAGLDLQNPIFQSPQPAMVVQPTDAAALAQSVNGWIRTANALSNYHKQVPLNAFNSIYLLNLLSGWGGWRGPR